MDHIYVLLELLARGTFTNQSTLVSEKFSSGFLKMLDNKDCIIRKNDEKAKVQDDQSEKSNHEPPLSGGGFAAAILGLKPKGKSAMIDMRKFERLIKRNKIDVEYLNQTLKSDNEFIMEGDYDDEDDN